MGSENGIGDRLNDAIRQGDEDHAVDGPLKPQETKKGFSLGFNLDSLLGKAPNITSAKRTDSEAKLGVAPELGRVFVFSGYNLSLSHSRRCRPCPYRGYRWSS